MGLVVGLNGTGDSSRISGQLLRALSDARESPVADRSRIRQCALVWVTAGWGRGIWRVTYRYHRGRWGTVEPAGGILLATELKSFDSEVMRWRVSSFQRFHGRQATPVPGSPLSDGGTGAGSHVEKRGGRVVEEIGGQRYVTLKLLQRTFNRRADSSGD